MVRKEVSVFSRGSDITSLEYCSEEKTGPTTVIPPDSEVKVHEKGDLFKRPRRIDLPTEERSV